MTGGTPLSRRGFLARCAGAALGTSRPAGGPFPGFQIEATAPHGAQPDPDGSSFPWGRLRDLLHTRFRDPRRHFVFEYYPWYANDPFFHWRQQWDRNPPDDLATNTVPRLGAYDSRSTAVLEQHARWIAESGVGTIDMSWWGRGSFIDRAVHQVMDVMAAHDIHVMFHLEPYGEDRVEQFPADVLYLLEEFGERRRWDCWYFNERDGGRQAPVFKTFNTLLPERIRDCHGNLQNVTGYVPDGEWRRATDRLRDTLAGEFPDLALLSDSVDAQRARDAGFDGVAPYGPLTDRSTWLGTALAASRLGLAFSFNPGLDEIDRRTVPPDSCYAPRPFLPPTRPFEWSDPLERERAAGLAERQIDETLQWALLLQTDPWLVRDLDFFLLFICSFNEWHEGHQFETDEGRRLPDAGRAGAQLPQPARRRVPPAPPHGCARTAGLTTAHAPGKQRGAGAGGDWAIATALAAIATAPPAPRCRARRRTSRCDPGRSRPSAAAWRRRARPCRRRP